MEVKIQITADKTELNTIQSLLSEIEDQIDTEVTPDSEKPEEDGQLDELTEEELYVLAAVQQKPRRALRIIHRKATELDGSPFSDYATDDEDRRGWNDERERVQSILWGMNGEYVEHDGQRWFPKEDLPAVELPC